MKKGKIDLNNLNEVIKTYTGVQKKQTLLSSSIGEDSCLIDLKSFDDDIMLISSDPITFTSKNIGKLSVIINTNDIYASGGLGYGIILNVFIPPNKTIDDFKNLMEEIHKECIFHNLQILGGHTEVTDVINDIVVSVTIIGTSKKKYVVKTSSSNKGDLIFLTKTLGIEGTVVLFDEFRCELEKILTSNEIEEIEKFRDKISIRKECEILRSLKISSMHDITEGGLIGALFEMSMSSKNGFRIFKHNVIIHSVTKKICDYLKKDIYHLISSGNLLFTCESKYENLIKTAFSNENMECFLIGEVIEGGKYIINEDFDKEIPLNISDSFFD